MEEESLPSRRKTRGKQGKANPVQTPKVQTKTTANKGASKSQAKSAANAAGEEEDDLDAQDGRVDLGKNIDLEKMDPLYFVGEREATTKTNHYSESGGFNYDSFENTTPEFARPERRKDAEGRGVHDEGYDPTTLLIPKKEWDKFTPAIAQYWKIKEKNCEKIIFFKLGKFYEFLYEDAIVAVKELGIKFMGTKLHAGFPEAALEKYASILVEKGYTVGIVEQVETPQ